MKWNIFKRIAELEATVHALQDQVIRHGHNIADLHYNGGQADAPVVPSATDWGKAPVKAEGTPTPMTEEERQRELKRQYANQKNRNYYQNNRERILEKMRIKQKNEKRRQKMREYAKARYWRLKAEAAKATPVEQPRFIEAA